MTPFIKKKEIKKEWYIINAENVAVGRLASYISKVLRGKNKPTLQCFIETDYNEFPGEHRLHFTRLPNKCSVSIYTISGELVDKMVGVVQKSQMTEKLEAQM